MLSNSIVAKVKSVDRDKCYCDVAPVNGGADILDVQLRADDGKRNGQVIYPAKDSLVIVAPLDNSRSAFYVAMFSEVDEVWNEIENTRLIVGKQGLTISRGSDNLKDLLNEFVDQMLKIYAPKDVPGITKLKVKINNLLNSD